MAQQDQPGHRPLLLSADRFSESRVLWDVPSAYQQRWQPDCGAAREAEMKLVTARVTAAVPDEPAADLVGAPDDERERRDGGELAAGQGGRAEEPVHRGQVDHERPRTPARQRWRPAAVLLLNTPTWRSERGRCGPRTRCRPGRRRCRARRPWWPAGKLRFSGGPARSAAPGVQPACRSVRKKPAITSVAEIRPRKPQARASMPRLITPSRTPARRAVHQARLGGLAAERERRQGVGAQVDGEDLHHGQRQRHRPAGQREDQERQHLWDGVGEDVADELADVVVDAPPGLHRRARSWRSCRR